MRRRWNAVPRSSPRGQASSTRSASCAFACSGPTVRRAERGPEPRAVVCLVSYGETDVLLGADAESLQWLPLRLPPVEVLKVSHHGSADALLPALLEGIRPRVAVISVAKATPGHPTPETLAALDEGARSRRTGGPTVTERSRSSRTFSVATED